MLSFLSPALLGIVAAVVAVIIVISIVVKRYRIVRPDTAMIIVGSRKKGRGASDNIDLSGQKVVTGGGAFIWPFIQQSYDISLGSRRLALSATGPLINGITIKAEAVAVIKVGGSEEMIRAAAQRFLTTPNEIEVTATEVLSGSLRSILGTLTVQEIITDRTKVAGQVLIAATEALEKQGLIIDTLQIQEIKDPTGDYIENLGRPEAAAVRKAAQIADTEANREAEEARIAADKVIIDKNRELKLEEAAAQIETDKAAATAAAAKPLEEALQQQRITEQEAITAQKKADLKEQELNASVRKEAEAEAYRLSTIAKGDAEATIAKAEAGRRERELAAQALEAEGKAEAVAIEAKGRAEAVTIQARGDALATEAASILAQQMIEVLPQMAKALAEGYANSNMTIVSADGANKVTGDVIGGMTSLNTMMKDAVGIDIASIINGRVVGESIGDGLGKARGSRTDKNAIVLSETAPTTHSETEPEEDSTTADETMVEEPATIETEQPVQEVTVVTPPTKVVEETPVAVPSGPLSNPGNVFTTSKEFSDIIAQFSILLRTPASAGVKLYSKQLGKTLSTVEDMLAQAENAGLDLTQAPYNTLLSRVKKQINQSLAKLDDKAEQEGVKIPGSQLKKYPHIRGLLLSR